MKNDKMIKRINSVEKILDVLHLSADELISKVRCRNHHDLRMIYAHIRQAEGATVTMLQDELGRSRRVIDKMLSDFHSLYITTPAFRVLAVGVYLKLAARR